MGTNRRKRVPMASKYTKLSKHPRTFLRLFGITPSQAAEIITSTRPLWEKNVLGRYKRPGRDFKLEFEDMVLMLLLYYRSYTTQLYVGFIFGLDDSRVCRIIKRLEPILARVMRISKDRTLSQDDIECLMDATEQPIERPQRGQKAYYSGKKKRHTVKTEIRTRLDGEIIHVSKSRPGSVHDFSLYKQGDPIARRAKVYVDGGYQGLQKLNPNTEVPFKKSKGNSLKPEEKIYNRALSRIRVKVENVFAQLKSFKILAERYRNKGKAYNLKFKIIAGIVNLKNGFSTI